MNETKTEVPSRVLAHLDNPVIWARAIRTAVEIGILHATYGEKTLTECALWPIISARLGGVNGRHGQIRALRTAYGAALAGPAIVRRVQKLNPA